MAWIWVPEATGTPDPAARIAFALPIAGAAGPLGRHGPGDPRQRIGWSNL